MGKVWKKCCLLVLDGWGYNETRDPCVKDAIAEANPVQMISLSCRYPSFLLYAHGTYVGLSSDSDMGNSEVGHLTIGAGRAVMQDSVRIRKAFESKDLRWMQQIIFSGEEKTTHILGILSDGNIHGHWKDILDLSILASSNSKRVVIHTVSDGRDTRERAYLEYLEKLAGSLPENAQVGSVCGRYYAMDRDSREERTDLAFRTLTGTLADHPSVSGAGASAHGDNGSKNPTSKEIAKHIEKEYEKNTTDEFITPFCAPGCEIEKGSRLIISNFRVDRVKQIYAKFESYTETYTMTRVHQDQPEKEVIFERPRVTRTLGDVIEENGISQARVAETEKKAHVTFFFDGGENKQRTSETRCIVPSKKVQTHDLAPKMSAEEIKKATCTEMKKSTGFILANFANCDMVGHTGNFGAAVQAVKETDRMVGEIHRAAMENGYALVVTADHGNAEIMEDMHGTVKTHTRNRVPAIIALPKEEEMEKKAAWGFSSEGSRTLADIAPTVLEIMGIEKPPEMTGTSLLSSTKTSFDCKNK